MCEAIVWSEVLSDEVYIIRVNSRLAPARTELNYLLSNLFIAMFVLNKISYNECSFVFEEKHLDRILVCL